MSFCSVTNIPDSLFQILLSRDQSGTQLPPRAGNHLQRSEAGQRAAGLWGTHQTYRLWHVQGVVCSLLCMKSWCHDALWIKAAVELHECWFTAVWDDHFIFAGGLETRGHNEHFLWYPQLHCPGNTARRGLRWGLHHTSTYDYECYSGTVVFNIP